MADNIAPDEVKRRLIIFLRIPSETWTDVLAMFTRRTLIRKIAPACYRLKEICDKNVKSIHVIRKAHLFNNSLEKNEPEANRQLEHLAANKCALAGQFRLISIRITDDKIGEAMFRDCPDLLRGCQFALKHGHYCRHSSFKQACLARIEPHQPVSLQLLQIEPAKNSLLEHPTVWKCNRLSLDLSRSRAHRTNKPGPGTFKDIHKWLHRHDHVEQMGEEIRCMNLYLHFREDPSINIDWLLNQCVQDFKRSAEPTDRRKFVLNFTYCTAIELANSFDLIENHSTGEVLLLQLLARDRKFCLRRCMAEEVGGQKEFYEKMFKWNGFRVKFNIDELKRAEVWVY